MLELAISQKMQRGPIKSLRHMHPAFGGVGLLGVISAFLVVAYYAVVMALTYASYKKPDEDIVQSSWLTVFSDLLISLFAGFVVFAVLGYMAWNAGVSVEEVTTSGPGLAMVRGWGVIEGHRETTHD